MDFQLLIVAAVVVLCVLYAVRYWIRSWASNKAGRCGGCSRCQTEKPDANHD